MPVTSLQTVHGYAVGDVNGDGRQDILCAVGWYEHPAGDPFAQPWRLHPETALRIASSPFLVVDVNRDGRNDLIWGRGHDYGVYWWEQGQPTAEGTTTWEEHLIDKSWSQAHSLAWTDWFAAPDFVPRRCAIFPRFRWASERRSSMQITGDHLYDVDADGWIVM